MSFWLDNIPKDSSEAEAVNLDVVFDAVIIGCGISGASTAYHLAQNNPAGKYLILERGCISSGATGCNGGFICPGTSERFSSSVERYGLEATQELYDYTVKCTAAVKDFVEKTNADCEIRFHGCVQLAINESELQALQLSYEQLKSYGQSAEWWDAATCAERTHSGSYLGGLFKPQAGMLWAAKLVHALVNEAKKLGVRICTNSPVEKVENTSDGISIHTSDGRVVRTKKVVYCTNAWSRELLPELKDVIIPVRNQLIMTEPVQRLWDFSLSCNSGYEYFMQRPDGRILLGGMRNITPDQEYNNADPVTLNPTVSAALCAYLPKHFSGIKATSTASVVGEMPEPVVAPAQDAPASAPASVAVESEWIGIMGFTPDRNPLVGALATRPGEFIAAGYTGHGMPVAYLAGRNIAEMICGVKSDIPVPAAYSPSRFNV